MNMNSQSFDADKFCIAKETFAVYPLGKKPQILTRHFWLHILLLFSDL